MAYVIQPGKEENPITKMYRENKMMTMTKRHSSIEYPDCAKCRHQIRDGQKYYRDVVAHHLAHITCPNKKSHMALALEELSA